MLELKAKSNLRNNPDFRLDKFALNSGFMAIYLKSPSLNPRLFTRMWATQYFPQLANDPTFGVNRANNKKAVTAISKKLTVGMVQVHKTEQDVIVSVPLVQVAEPQTLSTYAFLMTNTKKSKRIVSATQDEEDEGLDEDIEQSDEDIEDEGEEVQIDPRALPPPPTIEFGTQSASAIIDSIAADPRTKEQLRKCFLGTVTYPRGSMGAIIFAQFILTKAECQYLTNTHWNLIRPIDIYSIMMTWSLGYYGGKKVKPPRTSFSISDIAKTLPTDKKALTYKIDEHGLSIDRHGKLVYLPRDLDNTSRYEDLFTQAGTSEDDGAFALVRPTDDSLEAKLPKNIPVLIDWVNCKFSYTNTSGLLTVMDVSRNLKANATHVNTFLHKAVDTDPMVNIVRMAESAGVPSTLRTKAEELVYIDSDGKTHDLIPAFEADPTFDPSSPPAYLGSISKVYTRLTGMPLRWGDLAYNSSFPPARALGRYLRDACLAVMDRLDNVYEKYSVAFVTANVGLLVLIKEYAHLWSDVTDKDKQLRGAAMNQGVDPNWKAPSLPLINPKVGRLPHQHKVANIMRGSPNFAILPVQAGGGKSMLAITDVLQEIKANRSAPYLIMCPGHLVAQYVKELVFFTKGRINAIPINSYVIRKNGLERLTKLVQTAPRNSVVIVNYDVLRLQATQICYGTTSVPVFPVAEILRQFDFQYCMLDESHYLKNDTARSRSVLALVSDIPKKRLASGTMAHDSPADLVTQISMLDPTLFGTKDEFNERYATEDGVKGGRIVHWRPGAQKEVMQAIKSRVVVAGAMRKEWAALLPPIKEQFIKVDLTEEQRRIYQALLTQTLEEIKKDSALTKRMSEAEEEDLTDEDAGEDLAALLKPYLARIEQFISAPARDALGSIELKGLDRVSPKVAVIEERIRHHLSNKIPGKILVFTNYTASAEEIYAGLSPDIRAQTILYKAENKIEDHAAFESDPNMKILIGVENSLNTGLNLQFVSRLLRCETVWNPGTLEQGNSRLNRPELKIGDGRDTIYYDWIIADRTIDITKVSRLISKIIAIAKFENANDEAYQSIEDVPVIKMTLENIEGLNSWEEQLPEYAMAYRDYHSVLAEDYAEYKRKFVEKYGENFFFPIEEAPPPSDAKLMKRAPYTPGLEIYGQDELGLVRLDQYLRSDDLGEDIANENGLDDDSELDLKSDEGQDAIIQSLTGRRVHTEFGDGVIHRVALRGRRVRVRLDDGTTAIFQMSAVFIPTRDLTSTKDIRNQLLKQIGDIPVDTQVDVPIGNLQKVRLTKRELHRQQKEKEEKEKEMMEKLNIELDITVVNGFLGLVYFPTDESEDSQKVLTGLGFRPTPQFYYAPMVNAQRLYKQIALWNEKGFTPDPMLGNEMNAIKELWNLLKTGKLKSRHATFNLVNKNELRNFYRMEHKPNSSKTVIRPYPIIEDGVAYLALPIRGQVGTKAAIRVRAPGVQWTLSEPSLTYYGLTQAKIGEMINKVRNAGITITNVKDLHKQYKKLKMVKPRDTGIDMM